MDNTQHQSSQRQERSEPQMLPAGQPITSISADEAAPGHAAALRDLLVRVGNTCKKPVAHAMHVRETTALIRLSDEASGKVTSLIDAGVFHTRWEAAAFFVEEGIKAKDSLFRQVSQQLSEIESLRSVVRNGHRKPQ